MFKYGDKVRCVKTEPQMGLTLDKVYTVIKVKKYGPLVPLLVIRNDKG